MQVSILSVDFKTAPIELLEQLACNKDDMTHYLSALIPTMFIDEMVIISTCNRTEWVFRSPEPKKAMDVLITSIKDKTGIATSIIKKIATIYNDQSAKQHLFELACGLKSMVIGENEILTQVKKGHAFCMEFGATGSALNKLFQSVVAMGKDVRTHTKISSGAHSISSIAIEAIKKKQPEFISSPILLVGAGVMIQRALVKLTAMGHTQISISNRTMSKVEELANVYDQVTVVPFANIRKKLHLFKTIYVAISTKQYLIQASDLAGLDQETVIVDLGIPRNIDPDCQHHPLTQVIGVTQLESISSATIQTRTNDIDKVMLMIQSGIQDLNRWESYRSQARPWPEQQYA